jgi:hypothetical protein
MSTQCTALMIAGQASQHRSVLFIEATEMRHVNIAADFKKLPLTIQRTFLRRFDNWIDGFRNRAHYHGWEKSQYGGHYQECYVFKCQEHRLYGFLCHPKAPGDPAYECCVLAYHAFKQKWTTDETELSRAKAISENRAVMVAVHSLLAA